MPASTKPKPSRMPIPLDRGWFLWVLLLLGLVGGASTVWPLTGAIWKAMAALPEASGALTPDLDRLWRSCITAALIAALATLLGIAPAWAMCRAPRIWAPLIVAPMFLPSYAAYSGWGLIRSPGTSPAAFLAGASEEVALLVSYALAVGGLALWAWPIAALAIAARVYRIDPVLLDALRVAPVNWFARARMRLAFLRPALAIAWLIVFLLMLGSAVPLHVAQVETYAIALWIDLAIVPAPQVLLSAWPLLLIGACAASVLAWRIDPRGSIERVGAAPFVGRLARAIALIVWLMSTVVPAALFLLIGLRNPSTGGYRFDALSRFWSELGVAMADSMLIATVTGLCGAVIALGVWMAVEARSRAARVAIWLFAVGALTPGILIGAAVQEAYSVPWLRPIGDSFLAVVLAHIARFGVLGAIGGWWLALSQPRELRDLRRLATGSTTIRNWWILTHPHSTVGILGIALMTGILSFHEIEAAIMVLPPGLESFPQRMLQLLHFQREDMLSAGVL